MATSPSIPMYDKKEQFQKIESALLQGEKVYAVFDMKGGDTGFLGITDMQVIVYDKSFMRKMKAVVSIPYSRIYMAAAKDESGLVTGRGHIHLHVAASGHSPGNPHG